MSLILALWDDGSALTQCPATGAHSGGALLCTARRGLMARGRDHPEEGGGRKNRVLCPLQRVYVTPFPLLTHAHTHTHKPNPWVVVVQTPVCSVQGRLYVNFLNTNSQILVSVMSIACNEHTHHKSQCYRAEVGWLAKLLYTPLVWL